MYLMGGERRELEVADYPHEQKRLVRVGEKVQIFPWSSAQAFGPPASKGS